MDLYNIVADLHTHTIYSHKGTVLANVRQLGEGVKK